MDMCGVSLSTIYLVHTLVDPTERRTNTYIRVFMKRVYQYIQYMYPSNDCVHREWSKLLMDFRL